MKLYLVTADTWDDGYGTMISCFGIATNEELLKNITEKVEKEGYFPNVAEINSDEFTNEYLGGYYE